MHGVLSVEIWLLVLSVWMWNSRLVNCVVSWWFLVSLVCLLYHFLKYHNVQESIGYVASWLLLVGETGASCYNFHSKSLFHKNMPARYFSWT